MSAVSIIRNIKQVLASKGYVPANYSKNGKLVVNSGDNIYYVLYDIRSPKYCTLMIWEGGRVTKDGTPEAVEEYVKTTLPTFKA